MNWNSMLPAAMIALSLGVGAATTTTVPAGETHVLTAAENVHGDVFVLSAGSTLKLPENAGDFTLHPFVKLVGAATLDTGDATSLVVAGGLWADGSHALTVSGLGEFAFGRDNGGSWAFSNDLYARFDVGTVNFPANTAARIVFTNDVASFRLPACDVTIAGGTRLLAMGANAAGVSRFVTNNVIEVSGWTLIHGRSDGVANSHTVRVASGGAYHQMPRVVSDDWYLTEYGVIAASGKNSFGEKVELAEGALLGMHAYSTASDHFFGPKVSGGGTVRFFNDGDANVKTSGMMNSFSFDGALVVDDAFDLTLGSPASVGSLTISGRSVIRGGDELTVGALAAGCEAKLVDFSRITVTGACGAGAKFTIESTKDVICDLSAATAPLPEVGACNDSSVSVKTPNGVAAPFVAQWSPSQTNWQAKVCLHFDASDESSLLYYHDDALGQVTYTNGFPLMIGIVDQASKGKKGGYALRSLRGLNSDGSPKSTDEHRETCPYLVPNGLNGRNYLCFGAPFGNAISQRYGRAGGSDGATVNEARRVELFQANATTDSSLASSTQWQGVRYAIMVFGSQQGGGFALLGVNKDNAQKGVISRGGSALSAPLVNASGYAARLDGVSVTPTEGNLLNGGWQIVSLELAAGDRFAGLGWNCNYTDAGGQNYAEVVLFGEVPTDAERDACERYLAMKWGLAAPYRGQLYPAVRSDADGILVLDADGRIGGGYRGTITVPAGRTLELPEYAAIPGEEAVVSANRVAWFDPSCPGAILQAVSNGQYPEEDVGVLLCRDENGAVEDSGAYYFSGYRDSSTDRSPWKDATLRGCGMASPWMNFRDSDAVLAEKPNGNGGNVLRIRQGKASATTISNTSMVQLPETREAFIVVDSSRGGGNVLGMASSVTWGDYWPGARVGGGIVATDAILTKTGTVHDGTNTAVRLDDNAIDGWTTGYNGRPEVLTITTTTAFRPSALGLYNQPPDSNGRNQREIIGETIFYSQPLSDEARNKVTAYLARKWFGKCLDGYSDVTAATVLGSGTVAIRRPRVDGLPDLSGFTGTFACIVPTLEFTAKADGSVAGAIEVPGVAIDLSAVGAVTVAAEGGEFRKGEYVLASGTAITYGENLRLELEGTVSGDHRVQFRKDATSLVLVIELKPGLTVSFR